jgi:serine/threonine protein kinase
MAPEIAASCGQIDEKVDVYSFGIVVLEIMSGRKREDSSQKSPTEEKHLRHWVCAILQ